MAMDAAATTRIEQEHNELARFIESISQFCNVPVTAGCGDCAADQQRRCGDSMADIGGEILKFMLRHFDHEEQLMASIPQTRRSRDHVTRHREAHVRFSTSYNSLIAGLDADNARFSTARLESCHVELVQDHALRFDVELASLLPRESAYGTQD